MNTSPAKLAAILQPINSYRNRTDTKNLLVISTIRLQDNVWHIELVLKGRSDETARVNALIYENGNNESSYLIGTSIGQGLGLFTLFLLLIFILGPIFSTIMPLKASYLYLALALAWWWSPLIILLSALLWRMNYQNNAYLLNLIQNAVESANEQHPAKAKAS